MMLTSISPPASLFGPSRRLAVCVALLVATHAHAEVKLPEVFSDGMVLQRDMPLPIGGTAAPGEQVTVRLAGQQKSTVADGQGNWRVTLEALSAGAVGDLVVTGSNKITLSDVLAGEVWVCSGQSNMRWYVRDAWNADLEIPKANHREIRLLTLNSPGSQTPQTRCDAPWVACTPQTVGGFSAVGYYFGLELHERLKVPVGLIHNAWGGSACEAWIPLDRLEKDPRYAPLLERWEKIVAGYDEAGEQAKHEVRVAKWKKEQAAAKAAGRPAPQRPRLDNPLVGQHRPANLYNSRLTPLMPLPIRGVIWYQGENNAGRAYQYRELFPLMIRSWREAWGQGDFPFYWVQLADFKPMHAEPRESDWAELREAQTLTLDREPHTGQAVIIDLGEVADIHPRKKMEVARRLARLALANEYGFKTAHKSPRFDRLERVDDALVITLKDCDQPLRTVDQPEVLGFTVAGADRKWRHATAEILGKNQIRVHCDQVTDPVAVRYAWADNPVCNLFTTAGLPVTPFRTDDWPGKTIHNQ
ncbi:sialate O-acetylesterase [Botrimarina hoheduenensis]|uniref:Sialate O-acetylesterase domain-containing protein n=1 Tax=Botrimarina hoheduenensis TaxID=2528000 RepID=A0A5C5W8R9_9BACT|nr:sialate O-acetylesterase [Botrimarina hoheduenensis]TWT46877.1 hypothetical protein Pla111_19790 [Botrimarina hoheduenensis]